MREATGTISSDRNSIQRCHGHLSYTTARVNTEIRITSWKSRLTKNLIVLVESEIKHEIAYKVIIKTSEKRASEEFSLKKDKPRMVVLLHAIHRGMDSE